MDGASPAGGTDRGFDRRGLEPSSDSLPEQGAGKQRPEGAESSPHGKNLGRGARREAGEDVALALKAPHGSSQISAAAGLCREGGRGGQSKGARQATASSLWEK